MSISLLGDAEKMELIEIRNKLIESLQEYSENIQVFRNWGNTPNLVEDLVMFNYDDSLFLGLTKVNKTYFRKNKIDYEIDFNNSSWVRKLLYYLDYDSGIKQSRDYNGEIEHIINIKIKDVFNYVIYFKTQIYPLPQN